MSQAQHGTHNHTIQGPLPPQGPPYPPRTASLGGVPSVNLDVPVSGAFLCVYAIFAAVHLTILRSNTAKGHKFIFSGALFGFCMLRIVTMSLRIAWAFNQRNVSLGIAAQVFVYVGTVILFLINWIFTQRIVRAQHPTWGWSQTYRVLHRFALIVLIGLLLTLLVAAVQQVFTLNPRTLHIDRILQLVGQTYFAAFCLLPVLLTVISLALPRKETEKFGAGRLRNNIAILFCSALVLASGAIFRAVTAWEPQIPLRDAQGLPSLTPWYLSKPCFYGFNFTTELFVVIMFALTRVDLRFHVSDGSKAPGMYREGRNSKYYGDSAITVNEKNRTHASTSTEPISELPETGSMVGDEGVDAETRTLVESYRYPSSVLEVDQRTGTWKIKTVSHSGSRAGSSRRRSQLSESWNADDAPPLPTKQSNWPLPDSGSPADSVPVLEHKNRRSMPGSITDESPREAFNLAEDPDMQKALAYTVNKLTGQHASVRKSRSDVFENSRPPSYRTAVEGPARANSLPKKHTYRPANISKPRSRRSLQQDSSSSRYSSSPTPEEQQDEGDRATPEEILRQNLKEINEAADSQSCDYHTAEEEFSKFDYSAPPRKGDYDWE